LVELRLGVDCGDICEPAKVDLVRHCANRDRPAHREHDSFTSDQRYVYPEGMEAIEVSLLTQCL